MVAADAGQALAILRHEAIEIMITDYQMPGIDGIQLCQMTRSQPAHLSLPIVLLSAATEPAYAPRVWTHFLRRPASIRELIALIDVHAATRLTRAVHASAGAVRRRCMHRTGRVALASRQRRLLALHRRHSRQCQDMTGPIGTRLV